MSLPLAARIIASFTTPDDLILVADRQPEPVLLAAAYLGRRAVGFTADRVETLRLRDRLHTRCSSEQSARITVHTSGPGNSLDSLDDNLDRLSGLDTASQLLGNVRLVIALAANEHGQPTAPPPSLYTASVRLLAAGGVLAIHTASHPTPAGDAMTHPHGQIVTDAHTAGLSYLQHIVILHTPIHRGRLQPPSQQGAAPPPSRTGQYLHQTIHSDLLVFTPPVDEPDLEEWEVGDV
ncbi:MAG: hypothetical protein ACJ73S_03525 [Mycobacteriales bacterium]